MKCPIDDVDLVMSERQGIEVDYCPKCRGVWLDRGELDKIIERSAAQNMAPQYQEASAAQGYRHRGDYNDERQYYNQKKKKSFLGDIFDF